MIEREANKRCMILSVQFFLLLLSLHRCFTSTSHDTLSLKTNGVKNRDQNKDGLQRFNVNGTESSIIETGLRCRQDF